MFQYHCLNPIAEKGLNFLAIIIKKQRQLTSVMQSL